MTRKTKTLHTLIVCAVCLLIPLGIIHADVYLKYKQHTDPFEVMGQLEPAKDMIRETWISKDMIRNNEGAKTVIMRLDKKIVYFINNQQKSYAELPMDVEKMANKAIEKDEKMSEQEKMQAKEFVQGLMKNMSELNITIKETAEKKKINNWDCRKYIQTTTTAMGPSITEIWATSDIKLDYELLNRMYASSMVMLPSLRDSIDGITKEMNKVKGITVYSVSTTTVMDAQIKSSQELMDFAEKEIPTAFYEPPEGYTKQDM